MNNPGTAAASMTDTEAFCYAVRTFFIDRQHRALLPTGNHAQLLGCDDVDVAAMWRGGECVASCSYGRPHRAPDDDCDCGIYGATSLQSLRWQSPDPAASIVAVIAAQGATIIGSQGLRTQAARVVAYWCHPAPMLDDAREVFAEQCPAAGAFTDLDAMLAAYGIPATSEVFAKIRRNIQHRISFGRAEIDAVNAFWAPPARAGLTRRLGHAGRAVAHVVQRQFVRFGFERRNPNQHTRNTHP
jgi:hypothetical protein